MKALFLLLLPVLCAFMAYSQNSFPEELTATPPRHQAGDFYIGAAPVYYSNSVVNSSAMAIGIKSKIYLGNRVSFDGDLVLSEDYWHMAIGFLPICLNFLFQLTDDEVSILLLLFSFGQLAIHFPIANQAEISPYVGFVITSYSIHYTKLYELIVRTVDRGIGKAPIVINKANNRILIEEVPAMQRWVKRIVASFKNHRLFLYLRMLIDQVFEIDVVIGIKKLKPFRFRTQCFFESNKLA